MYANISKAESVCRRSSSTPRSSSSLNQFIWYIHCLSPAVGQFRVQHRSVDTLTSISNVGLLCHRTLLSICSEYLVTHVQNTRSADSQWSKVSSTGVRLALVQRMIFCVLVWNCGVVVRWGIYVLWTFGQHRSLPSYLIISRPGRVECISCVRRKILRINIPFGQRWKQVNETEEQVSFLLCRFSGGSVCVWNHLTRRMTNQVDCEQILKRSTGKHRSSHCSTSSIHSRRSQPSHGRFYFTHAYAGLHRSEHGPHCDRQSLVDPSSIHRSSLWSACSASVCSVSFGLLTEQHHHQQQSWFEQWSICISIQISSRKIWTASTQSR